MNIGIKVIIILLMGCYGMITPHNMKIKIAVFCSADDKISDEFKITAYKFGKQLAEHNFGLITGGSRTGLMKEVIDGYVGAALDLSHLYGVLPQALSFYDVHHHSIPKDNLLWTESIHQRLDVFQELADVVVVLPGGFGTLHELMDSLVHNQFAIHNKPIVLVNSGGYWDFLLRQFQKMLQIHTVTSKHLNILLVVESEDKCIEILKQKEYKESVTGLEERYWERS